MEAGGAAFSVLFAALYVGHVVGDHWVQTSCQAIHKAAPTWAGRLACARHVGTLTLTKLVLAAAVVIVFHIHLTWWQAVAAVAIDAGSHYWADRRVTLERLARRRWVNKGEFYDQGTDLVNAEGETRPHIGTGRYALDQSWHVLWLFVATLVATA